MLDIKKRQTILKKLNLYDDSIDGIEGPKTKNAYKKLQEKYFKRKKDIDGIYGKNTNILLENLNTFIDSKYFKLEEFKCHCNNLCTGYPHVINKNLLNNLNSFRSIYGKTIISSGLRCDKHNHNVNGSNSSKHLIGKACDIINPNINKITDKKNAIDKWLSFNYSDMAYFNGYMKRKGERPFDYRSKTMSNALHLQVK